MQWGAKKRFFLFIRRRRIHDAATVERRVDGKTDAKGGIYLGDFFDSQDIGQITDVAAAECFRIAEAEHAHLTKFFKGFEGEFRSFIAFYHTGP